MSIQRKRWISIPYRSYSNLCSAPQKNPRHGFQSLIGLILTSVQYRIKSYQNIFQSLIGLILTGMRGRDGARTHEFQSLIGLILTYYRERSWWNVEKISIPYRSYSNGKAAGDCGKGFWISIPYRSYSNLWIWAIKTSPTFISIPYRSYSNAAYKVHTAGRAIISIPYRSYSNSLLSSSRLLLPALISIPYRSYSNIKTLSTSRNGDSLFQSLIGLILTGSLKTNTTVSINFNPLKVLF